ncbi:carbon-nitrogen hydrolase family protein [Allorhizocola rhizosphaerae]|uniref:carbon-nitrogen hydrolase family protein n=1 Tax=Allorhizocola rhizosphaerae TaxID=1872709 RepID=UPI002482584D|nr:carbon-nitrogen hydrolase family protein [Allorhizocola rhizosphaerae]
MRGPLRVGACQTPEFLGDVEASLACMADFARQADADCIDLLLFPECFLQGYLVEQEHLRRYALNLRSAGFASLLQGLASIKQALVFGVIEEREGRYFNTAVVVSRGELLGFYRKTHLVAGESLFDKGSAYPVFDMRGVRFGINICYDTQFAQAAAAVAEQGAQLLLVPAQNMMRRDNANRWKDLHHRIRAERARETGMWLMSADVTGERDEHRIGYGPTSVINPQGEVVAQVPLMTKGMVVADIPGPCSDYS